MSTTALPTAALPATALRSDCIAGHHGAKVRTKIMLIYVRERDAVSSTRPARGGDSPQNFSFSSAFTFSL